MKILKFGGSSIKDVDRIKSVLEIIAGAQKENGRIAVVVSAFGGVTDELIAISKVAAKGDNEFKERLNAVENRHIECVKNLIPVSEQSKSLVQVKVWFNDLYDVLNGLRLVGELSNRCLDYVMSFGELLSARIIAEAARATIPNVEFLDARRIIRANYDFGIGKIDYEASNELIEEYFKGSDSLPVITGFIASTPNEETITLGRGGSDFTASIVGAALRVEEIEIWTDVDGIMTADPRKVSKAFSQAALSYEEAMELSHFGAKVIYPPTMLPALEKQIPIRVRNTFNAGYAGTVVKPMANENQCEVTGITSISNVALLRVSGSGMVGVAGIARRLFSCLAEADVNVILITQASSEHTICFAVNPEDATNAVNAINNEFELELSRNRIREVAVQKDVSIISIVGDKMRETPGVSARAFHSLGKNGVNIIAIAQGSSERNISTVVAKIDETKALNSLHEEFFFPENKSINVFMVGTGLIGSALLKQIENHSQELSDKHSHEIRLIALANSSKHLVNPSGLDYQDVIENLKNSRANGNISDFVKKIKELNISNSVFVDCTASEKVCEFYPELLKSSISIITPNKKAQSSDFASWQALQLASKPRGVEFLFETSVGAGLPVISTLNDLLKSGDEIISIEAVLSGTLSFIFNSFDSSHSFSEVVLQAQQMGYTEPDPRDDLNGLDVARKILILARIVGAELEMSDIQIENLVPEDCREVDSVDQFFDRLRAADSHFEDKRLKAEEKNCKLCYAAVFSEGKASVNLKEINSEHPFYSLSGSDNIVSITSKRYNSRPLVVKGPGAGAEVTAAGVFADIIRIAS